MSGTAMSGTAVSGAGEPFHIGLSTLTALDRSTGARIWLATAPADMRCGFDRLAELAQVITDQNPLDGHVFLFRGRGGDRLKILYWDRDGYALWYKRLEEGVFKLPRIKGDDDPSLRLSSLKYSDLVGRYPKVARKFDNFPLAVMRVITDDEAKINELFVRLNSSKPLTGSELRNAMRGIVPELIRDIAQHTFFHQRIRFSTKRRQDLSVAAKLLIIEFRGQLVETKKTNIDRFVKEGEKAEAQTEDFKRAVKRVSNVLDRMNSIFVKQDTLLANQGPIPVYYWLVRQSPSVQDPRMRTFLTDFESKRRGNRLLAKKNAPGADVELGQYDTYDRSTNDPNSLEGRFEILRRRFAEYMRGR